MAYVKESAMQLMNDIANDPRVLVERTMDMPFQIRRYASFVAKKKKRGKTITTKTDGGLLRTRSIRIIYWWKHF